MMRKILVLAYSLVGFVVFAQKTHTVLNWVNYPKEDGESKFEDEDMDDANKLFV